jgi:hypothetical protein
MEIEVTDNIAIVTVMEPSRSIYKKEDVISRKKHLEDELAKLNAVLAAFK